MSNNLEINQGADYLRTATVLNTNNQAINLTGYTVSAQIRKNPTSSTYISFECLVTNAIQGKISFSLTHAQTTSLVDGRYMYDIFITSSSKRYKVTEGLITMIPQITR